MLSQRRWEFGAVPFVWLHCFIHIFGIFVDVVCLGHGRFIVIDNEVFCRFRNFNYSHISICYTAAAAALP